MFKWIIECNCDGIIENYNKTSKYYNKTLCMYVNAYMLPLITTAI